MPSRATTFIAYPWLCHGCIITPSFMNRMRTVSPTARQRPGTVAGKPCPLIVNPPSASFEIQTYSRSYRHRHLADGSTMNAPSRPRPTWSVALWCEWYMSEPAFRGGELVGIRLAGTIGCWVDERHAVLEEVVELDAVEVDAGRLLEVVREERADACRPG